MGIRPAVRVLISVLLSLAVQTPALAEDFADAVHAYLQQRVEAQTKSGCIVVGIVDEHGSSVVSYGKLDNGTDQQADGDTLFNIHSATGTFTHLLLQEMADRGEMKLDDPLAMYLPKSVRAPTRNGKQITLRILAKETSGLPDFYEALNPKRADNDLADFGIEQLNAFVSGSQLTSDPGMTHLHARVDLALLGQAMAYRTGADYESLMADRVFGPLQMDSTRFTLTPELKKRLAPEHSVFGYVIPPWNHGVLKPSAGLYSTVNDLLKFVSAYGLTPCNLTPEMGRAASNLSYAPEIEGMIHTGGGGFGGRSYVGYDKARHRGVVVLSTADDSGSELGNLFLESEWQSDRRPTAVKLTSPAYDLYLGQYRRVPDFAMGMFVVRQYFSNLSQAVVYSLVGICLAVLLALLWRAGSSRRRWIILACAALACGLLPPLIVMISGRVFCAKFEPGMGIRREGDRLIVQATGIDLCPIEEWRFSQAWGFQSHPIDVLFPRIPAELMPESETLFFERLSGTPMTFSRDAAGKVSGLTMQYRGRAFHYEKISDEPPVAVPAPERPVAIKLDTRLLDACAGGYEFAPDGASGIKMAIWREGDRLMVQAWGPNVIKGAIAFDPESGADFFDKIFGLRLTFIKNEKGQVTGVIHHFAGLADAEGKKQN
jgi:serine-type D-Ala-D-Ala carboxypeptidase/endopeptidase